MYRLLVHKLNLRPDHEERNTMGATDEAGGRNNIFECRQPLCSLSRRQTTYSSILLSQARARTGFVILTGCVA